MAETKKRSFYEPMQRPYKVLHDIRTVPPSMPICHYHNNYELYYLVHGRRNYFIKDKTYLIDGGSFVLLGEFDIHSTEAYEAEGYERYLISFDGDYIAPLLNEMGEGDLLNRILECGGIVKMPKEMQKTAEALLLNMLTDYENGKATDVAFSKSALTTLFMMMRSQLELLPKPIEATEPSRRTISETVGYINNNYNEDISLMSISERFYISPCYFSRNFKRYTGLGFNEYLNNVRIKEAKKLLSTTKMSITNVSYAVGYKSPTNFGRVFLKITGISPKQYRAEIKKNSSI